MTRTILSLRQIVSLRDELEDFLAGAVPTDLRVKLTVIWENIAQACDQAQQMQTALSTEPHQLDNMLGMPMLLEHPVLDLPDITVFSAGKSLPILTRLVSGAA